MSEFGPKIVDGVLQYVSSSCMKKFDPRHFAGCPRAWAFCYIAKIRSPPRKPQQIGLKMHERIEHYLKTGENVLADIERAGLHFIPKPDPGILVEHAATPASIGGRAPTVEGVAVVTKIDAINATNYYTDPENEIHVEPFAEVLDWKSSSNIGKYALTGDGIRDDIAMNVYGLHALDFIGRTWPGNFELDRIRLSHVYFGTKKRGTRKVTAVVPVEALTARLDKQAALIREIKEIAATVTPETAGEVECNDGACGAYSGCEYQSICVRPKSDAIRLMLGLPSNPNPGDSKMSILDKVNQDLETTTIPALNVADVVKRLGVASAACGYGFPKLTGEASAAAAAAGAAVPGPAGRLAGVEIATVEALVQAAADLESRAKESNPLTAPDAPPADPTQAAAPLPAEEVITLTPQQQEAVNTHPSQTAEVEKPEIAHKKPGRPSSPTAHLGSKFYKRKELEEYALSLEQGSGGGNTVSAGRFEAVQKQLGETLAQVEALRSNGDTSQVVEVQPVDGIRLFVDAFVEGADSLDPYMDRIAAEIVDKDPNALHLLCATNDSPMAFGKWRGVLTAYARENPPEPGTYYVIGSDEVRACFVDALRPLCAEFVRGVAR